MCVSCSLCPAGSVGAPGSLPHVSWVCPPNPKACILVSTSLSPFGSEAHLSAATLPLSVIGDPPFSSVSFIDILLSMFPTVLRRVDSRAALFFGLVCRSHGASVFRLLCQLVFCSIARPLPASLSAYVFFISLCFSLCCDDDASSYAPLSMIVIDVTTY